jgi:transposase
VAAGVRADRRRSPAYLNDYYQRELTESYFAADKQRFGRELPQVREDRREKATTGLTVLHNLFSVRVTAE